MAERNVLLQNVKHPFLVGLHYSFQTADKLYFVLDFINGGEVSSFAADRHLAHVSHLVGRDSQMHRAHEGRPE